MDQVLRNLTLEFLGNGKHKISAEKFFETQDGLFLDVRSKEEADSISIKMDLHPNIEVKNIPIDEIPDRIHEIAKDKSVGVFCPANFRSAIVFAYLLANGFSDVRVVEGGYSALTEALMPGRVLRVVQRGKKV